MRGQPQSRPSAEAPSSDVFTERPGLLERFRRGESQALSDVYWAHVDRVEQIVRRALRSGTGGAPVTSDVEDLLQEVFVKAFSARARESYDGIRDYFPYLATITRHTIVDAFRAKRRDLLVTPAEFEGMTATETIDSIGDESWSDPQTIAIVENFLADLPNDLARVHHQLYVVGGSQEMAARYLGISRQNIRTLDKKIRAGLRRALKALLNAKNSNQL